MTVNAFPSLVPSSRTFTPGVYPNTAFRSWNGTDKRVRHSNVMLASRLSLSFLWIKEDQMLDIFNHYQSALGGFLAFAVPGALLSGVSDVSDYTLADYLWRYVEPPIVEDLPCGTTGNSRHSVYVILESVQPEPVFVLGLAG
jgi:hypothetical protein